MKRRAFLKYVGAGAVVIGGSSIFSSWLAMGQDDALRSTYIPEQVAGFTVEETDILYLASLAPSGHNTQPWTVRVKEPGRWIIGSEQSRWLPAVDPTNRELLLSIGTFLENLTFAAGMYGYYTEIKVIARDSHNANLVEVNFIPGVLQDNLRSKIITRRTMRSTQLRNELKQADVDYLLLNKKDQIVYYPLVSEQGRYLAEGTLAANKVQALRESAQLELANWIRWSNAAAKKYRNGLTPESMELSGFARWYTKNFFNQQTVLEKSFREETIKKIEAQANNCGGWLVVTSPSQSITDIIHAGRALERVWLKAKDKNIAFHPMTQMLEESPWKDTLRQDLGLKEQIQFIIRVGYVEAYLPPVSLRMPMGSIVK
ncbi:MAG: nitroreductase [Firmicutes bacterium]|nr:nitroreductase [Bacillota bacterium]